jgi:tetratricopeptide (TPR) repeat protein
VKDAHDGGEVIWMGEDREAAAAALLDVGREYLRQKNSDQALAAFNETVAQYPGTEAAQEAEFRAGHALFQMGRLSEAAAQYRKVAEDSASSWASEALGWVPLPWREVGDHERAVAEVEQILREHPGKFDMDEAHELLGALYSDIGDWEAARRAYEVAAESADTDTRDSAEVGVAIASLMLGESPEQMQANLDVLREKLGIPGLPESVPPEGAPDSD